MRTLKWNVVPVMLCWCLCFAVGSSRGEEKGKWEPLFDGKTLEGWKSSEMEKYWSVKNGAITAHSSEETPCTENQFLVWQGGELGDFRLVLKFRIEGSEKANSGIQIRSKLEEDDHVVGYQADITKPGARYLGCLYDERGRKMLAERGQRTVVRPDGTMEKETLATPEEAAAAIGFSEDGWNEYEIVAEGNTITLKINGVETAKVVDEQEEERELSGILALQLHSGPPMTVQFKDVRVKRL